MHMIRQMHQEQDAPTLPATGLSFRLDDISVRFGGAPLSFVFHIEKMHHIHSQGGTIMAYTLALELPIFPMVMGI